MMYELKRLICACLLLFCPLVHDISGKVEIFGDLRVEVVFYALVVRKVFGKRCLVSLDLARSKSRPGQGPVLGREGVNTGPHLGEEQGGGGRVSVRKCR